MNYDLLGGPHHLSLPFCLWTKVLDRGRINDLLELIQRIIGLKVKGIDTVSLLLMEYPRQYF